MNDGQTAADWWETRYADADSIWSGRVNRVLADIASDLAPGTALDLGCGEGADALWLAEHRWRVTGVDISPTAVARARAAATAAQLEQRARFIAADLADWDTQDRFDLVAASFLQSWPVVIPRHEILRRATRFVAPAGHLLVVAHAGAPPWSDPGHEDASRFPSPEEDLAALELDPREWEVVLAEARARTATAPPGHGHNAGFEVLDGIVLVRRLDSPRR